jgi:hypothetical protein
MKLSLRNKVPPQYSQAAFTRIVEDIERQVSLVSEGRLAGTYNAYTAAPTTGTWAKGDFVRNSNPAESGSASSKYVVLGWVCTVSGTPGTWLQCRVLTGN